ncbi:hypothetical protein FJZ40_01520 [Candidatus Shapirobacteria bacterium]|nr:hypothetical protein [Candidatus Shapirobacteria bacterium]
MKKSNYLSLIPLIILVLVLPVSVFLVGQKWLIPRAAGLPSPIILTPASGEFPVEATFSAKLSLNTEGVPIEGLDLVIVAHNLDISAQKALLPNTLFYQKEPEVFRGLLKLSILAKPEAPFSNTTPLDLALLTLRGRVSCQNANLAVDKSLSVVASRGQSIIGLPETPKFVIKTPAGITNPAFTSSATASAVLNQDFSYTATATNPNNGVLAFKYYNLPEFLLASGPNLTGKPDRMGTSTIDIEVTDSKGGSACQSLNLSVYDPTPIEITNIQAVANFNQATITWKTNREATTQIEYGKTAAYGSSTTKDENLVKNHAVSLKNLEQLTTYHFRVKSAAPGASEAVSGNQTFTTTATPTQSLNIKFQFQGKKANQNNHQLTIWAKGTGFKKQLTGTPDGTLIIPIKGELANRETPYEILLRGYQNLAIKRQIPIHDGPNPPQGYLEFSDLPCGDIAPSGNTDNMVNSLDWGYMATEWNIDKDKGSIADMNDDRRVNSLDYSLLISRFGLKGDE